MAPRQTVYRALISAEDIAVWMVPDGMTGYVHAFEAREGGAFRMSLTYEQPTDQGKTNPHTDTYHGTFVRLVPDREVAEVVEFETGNPLLQGEMPITMVLRDIGGGTEIVAVHGCLPAGLRPSDNELGWRMSLGKLKALVEERAL